MDIESGTFAEVRSAFVGHRAEHLPLIMEFSRILVAAFVTTEFLF